MLLCTHYSMLNVPSMFHHVETSKQKPVPACRSYLTDMSKGTPSQSSAVINIQFFQVLAVGCKIVDTDIIHLKKQK